MIQTGRTRIEDAFTAKIDALTKVAILSGVTSFPALLRALPSVYPPEVLASLDRLGESGACHYELVTSIRRAASVNCAGPTEGRSLLPLPHPLDYEWRFTQDASRQLLDRAAALTPVGGDVLLFGTPGLAVEALALPIGRLIAFVGENNRVTDRVVALNCAIGSPLSIAFCGSGLPRESADAVLLDPPWYLDFIRPMLSAAANAARLNGVVLISLAPEATRPSAEADRKSTIHFARRLGLDLLDHVELAIGYETPFFERNALTAACIYPPPRWRRGDLLVFRKTRRPVRPFVAAPPRRRVWTEVAIDRMRVMIRLIPNAAPGDSGLISYVEGDVLPTVSRRDRRRGLAHVWTSGNRVFRTSNPQRLIEAAFLCSSESMDSGIQPQLWRTLRDSDALQRVAAELRALAALEAEEERSKATADPEWSVTWRLDSMKSSNRLTAISSG